ncbi:MAG: YciI family protein [Pseudonocardiaceae bacterium]
MFIISLTYVAPLERLDELMPEHVAFLDRYYAEGTFLVSGRKVPRTGGVILARGGSREEIVKIIENDPFRREGVAEYDVIEFIATRTSGALVDYREKLP